MRPLIALTLTAIALGCAGSRAEAPTQQQPTLTQVILTPDSVAVAPAGTRQFSVAGTWSDGGTAAPTVTYGATGGTITAAGLYTAGSTSGTFRVIAIEQGGTLADTSIVTISASLPPPTLTGLVLSPDTVTLAPAGTKQFNVTGTWSDGSSTTPTVTYGATGGTITTGGLYTAGSTTGTFRVIARQTGGTAADTSTVTISSSTPPPPTLTKLVLSPDTVTLAPAATQQFTVSGTWSDGSTTAPSVTYSATGGTITTGGLYTAGSSTGTFRVIAKQQSGTLADTSTVTIASGGGGGPTVLFAEKFEDANLAARGWYDLPGAVTSITTADHIPGDTASLEIDFPAGATVPSPAVGGRHLFTASDAVYLRYWVKYSSNWVGSGQTYQPHEFLFNTNLDDPYIGPAFTHLTVYIEHNYQNGGIAVLESQDGMNIDQSRAGQDLTNVTENRAISGCNGNADSSAYTCYQDGSTWVNGKAWQSSGPVFLPNPGTGYKNNWNMVEAYFKLNTIVNGIGQPDGIAQYWFNGQLVIDRRHLYLRTGAHPTMQFNQFLMLPYIGDGSPVAQKMWLNDMVVMTAHP